MAGDSRGACAGARSVVSCPGAPSCNPSFPEVTPIMRVCVFCSSSTGLPEAYTSAAHELGRALASRGHELVFGGFDTGTMGDVARGCAEAGGRVCGIIDDGLRIAGAAVFPCDQLIVEPDLAHRKARMAQVADAFVTLPGGLGTFDEYFSMMAQAKVGEVTARIVLLNVCGYFDPLVAMLDRSTQTGLNSTDWRDYGDVFVTADEALDYLEAHAR